MNNRLKGKIALVTGGTKGIGKAIAEKLSEVGAQVVVTARTPPKDSKNEHYFIEADHSLPESAETVAKEILNTYGTIDIIVNNAGASLSPGGGYSQITDEDWNNEFQLNLMAAVRMNKALLPTMVEKKRGVIINISMNPAMQPIWDMTMAYGALKAAANAYHKALATELGSKGIRVNTVSPGFVRTPQMESAMEKLAKSSNITVGEATKAVLDKLGYVPLDRVAQPEEIGNLVRFLVSPEAEYITGTIYQIDGGALATV